MHKKQNRDKSNELLNRVASRNTCNIYHFSNIQNNNTKTMSHSSYKQIRALQHYMLSALATGQCSKNNALSNTRHRLLNRDKTNEILNGEPSINTSYISFQQYTNNFTKAMNIQIDSTCFLFSANQNNYSCNSR